MTFKDKVIHHYFKTVLLILFLSLVLRLFVISVIHHRDKDMEDSILSGDFIFGTKISYMLPWPFSDDFKGWIFSKPQTNDVVAFTIPGSETKQIRRVLAGEKQEVSLKSGVWFVDDKPAKLKSLKFDTKTLEGTDWGPLVVPEGHVFLIADILQPENGDSRLWGSVPILNIDSKAKWVWLSVETKESGWRLRLERIFASIK